MKLKRVFAAVTAFTLCASLAGCGATAAVSESAVESVAESTVESAAESAVEAEPATDESADTDAAEACLALYLPCEALLRPCAALHSAHLKLLQNWLETISDKYFALDRRLELICCKSLRGRICMWLLEQRERCGADTFSTAMTRTELAAFLNCDRSALSRELSRMQEEGLIELFRGSFKLPDPERLHAACPQF